MTGVWLPLEYRVYAFNINTDAHLIQKPTAILTHIALLQCSNQVSKNICILYSSVPTADSEPEDNECVEIQSEGEIIDDISDSESDPKRKVGPSQNAPSMALARWLLIFLMFMQAVYHLSDTVLTAFYVSSVSS